MKDDPPFILQICLKLCNFIHEYACLLPDRSAISEKLAKNTYTCERTAPKVVRCSTGVNLSEFPHIKYGEDMRNLHLWSVAPIGVRVFG